MASPCFDSSERKHFHMEATTLNIPVLALRGLTVFPHMSLTFDVERRISITALERAMEADQDIFLVTQREIGVNQPEEKDLYQVGTVSHITQILRLSANSVRVMDAEERQDILDYLADCSIFEDISVNGNRFVLAHADIHGFSEERDLEDYDISDFLFYRAQYQKRYFSGEHTFLVTGHTPTMMIREDGKPLVYQGNGHIGLDCGCVYGGKLAAYCLDTQEITYVDAEQKYYP